MKNKSKVNLIIDLAMFLIMLAIIGIGLLMKYVLLPGFERNIKYGKSVELYFWGVDRHQWGSVHLIIGLVLTLLLILHIILHWKQIVNVFKCLISNVIIRRFATSVFVILSVLFISFPLIVKPEVEDITGRHLQSNSHHNYFGNKRGLHTSHNTQRYIGHVNEVDIRGYMTLKEVVKKYDLSENFIKEEFNIPESVSSDLTLGILRKKYNFNLAELREYILDNN